MRLLVRSKSTTSIGGGDDSSSVGGLLLGPVVAADQRISPVSTMQAISPHYCLQG